jgi:hypothetical protein
MLCRKQLDSVQLIAYSTQCHVPKRVAGSASFFSTGILPAPINPEQCHDFVLGGSDLFVPQGQRKVASHEVAGSRTMELFVPQGTWEKPAKPHRTKSFQENRSLLNSSAWHTTNNI